MGASEEKLLSGRPEHKVNVNPNEIDGRNARVVWQPVASANSIECWAQMSGSWDSQWNKRKNQWIELKRICPGPQRRRGTNEVQVQRAQSQAPKAQCLQDQVNCKRRAMVLWSCTGTTEHKDVGRQKPAAMAIPRADGTPAKVRYTRDRGVVLPIHRCSQPNLFIYIYIIWIYYIIIYINIIILLLLFFFKKNIHTSYVWNPHTLLGLRSLVVRPAGFAWRGDPAHLAQGQSRCLAKGKPVRKVVKPWYRWPIEIDGLPIKNGWVFHGNVK